MWPRGSQAAQRHGSPWKCAPSHREGPPTPPGRQLLENVKFSFLFRGHECRHGRGETLGTPGTADGGVDGAGVTEVGWWALRNVNIEQTPRPGDPASGWAPSTKQGPTGTCTQRSEQRHNRQRQRPARCPPAEDREQSQAHMPRDAVQPQEGRKEGSSDRHSTTDGPGGRHAE